VCDDEVLWSYSFGYFALLVVVGLVSSLSAAPNMIILVHGEHPHFLAGIEVGCGKNGCSEHRSRNISEMEQDGAKVTIEYLYKVTYGVLISAEMYDLVSEN